MIANISDVISIVDAEGLIKYKSPNVERLFGWSPEEQIGLSGFITTHPDDIEYVQKMLLPLLQEENSRKTIELRFQCKDGSYKPVEITATNMLSDPLINGVLMNYHDISERKKGEEERARQSALINSLLDSIPDMVFFKDLEGAYLGCNPSFVEFVGKSRNEIIGRTDFDLFEKEVAGSFRHHDLKMLQNKRPNQNEEWITYPDGRKALLDTLKTPYLDNDGTLIGVLGVSRDITARKQAEIALVESSNKWAAIIKASPDGIGLFSLDGKIEFISDRYAFIHGFSIDEKFLYLGKSVYDFIDPSEHQVLADNFRKLISGEKDNPISEYIGIKKDKTRFVLSVNSAVLFSNDGKPANILVISRDITGQKVTEKRIMESEQRLQMVMDVTREAMWDLDIPSGKVLHNKQWYTLLGKQEGDIAGTLEAFDDIIHPDDKASVLEKIDAVMQGKADLYLSEHRLIGKDKTIWVQDRGAVVERDEQGNPLRMVGSYADITDRKKAENELKESLNRFDLLARHSRVFHWEVDASGLYTFVSDPVKDILGYEQEEIIGKKHFYDLHPGKGREAFKSAALEAFALKLPFSDLENPVESKTGEILWVSTNGLPIEDEKGNLTGYRGSDTDITLRKKSEEENIKLSKGIEQSSISIFITDGNGIIEYANPKFFEMTGYASNEIIGKTPRMFQSGKTPVETYKNLWETILSGKEWHGELLNRKKNGELYWESMSVSQVLNSRGEIINFIAIKEDITTRKQNERELLEANRSLELTTVKANELAIEAESSNRAKSVFLANMSHEIRTPLNAIIGFSQLLKREKLLTDSQIEYSNSINRAGEHLLQLINDILEYSKIEAGREVLNPINFNLPALLSEMQMMFKEEANSRKLQLIVEIPGELLQFVFADEQKLRRILINLIGNAVKFTTEGGVSVRSRIIKIDEHTSRFIAEVEDSGPGIPEQELGRLFKQFEQTSSGIKNSGGTGLGLVLSRQLALLMNGDITVASEEGTGSVFTINVEIREGKSEVGDVPIVKRVTGIKNPLYNYRVLVVDDKEENRMVIGNFLSLAGFETIYAVNGADGITKFEQWNPHLILMDMRMPEMDGYEATRLIKSTEKGKQTPVIVVTASSFEEEKKKNLGLEIQGYIRKPFRESELFGAIGKALGIEYTYEEETTTDTLMEYLSNDGIVDEDIAKLPHELVLQMKDAADAADFILLKELICQIDGEYSSLAKHLILRADSFDYNYFQKSLKTAEGKNEKPD
jgi:PAS domain S-box-containing protein